MFSSHVFGRIGLLTLAAGLIVLGDGSTPVQAGMITLVSQNRSVSVESPPSQQQFQSAPDFGPFNGVASLSTGTTPGGEPISRTASQQSSLTLSHAGDGALITALGSVSSFNNLGGSFPNGSVIFDVVFTITQPEPFYFNFSGEQQQNGMGSEGVLGGSFTGPGAPGNFNSPAPTGQFISGGILQPGTFEIHADIESFYTGQYNLTAAIGTAVPVPAAAWTALTTIPCIGFFLAKSRRRKSAI